jgi:N-formylglutamate amidohydrolase
MTGMRGDLAQQSAEWSQSALFSRRDARLNRLMDLPQATAELPPSPPVLVTRPAVQRSPLILASPHSGSNYPAEFVAAARLDTLSLRRSEDSFVDELVGGGPEQGVPLISATFPRAFCDPNREAWELDPAMFEETLPAWVNTTSARVGAGLGTIARVVSSGESIYRRKLRFAEAEARVRGFWEPYHTALAGLIAATRERFGLCLLVDCHSMPGHGCGGRAGSGPDFVLGDAHGTACAPRITRLVEITMMQLGYSVRRNDPYAGGYVTRHYGRPREHVHVLQIEIARGLYMDEMQIAKLPRFATVRRDLTTLIATLADAAPGLDIP